MPNSTNKTHVCISCTSFVHSHHSSRSARDRLDNVWYRHPQHYCTEFQHPLVVQSASSHHMFLLYATQIYKWSRTLAHTSDSLQRWVLYFLRWTCYTHGTLSHIQPLDRKFGLGLNLPLFGVVIVYSDQTVWLPLNLQSLMAVGDLVFYRRRQDKL